MGMQTRISQGYEVKLRTPREGDDDKVSIQVRDFRDAPTGTFDTRLGPVVASIDDLAEHIPDIKGNNLQLSAMPTGEQGLVLLHAGSKMYRVALAEGGLSFAEYAKQDTASPQELKSPAL